MEPDERHGDNDESQFGADPTEPQDGVTAQAPDADPAMATVAATAPARISRRRLIGVDALIGVTTLLLVIGIFAVATLSTWVALPDNSYAVLRGIVGGLAGPKVEDQGLIGCRERAGREQEEE